MITISNNSQEIVACNFWDYPLHVSGVSVNAGCIRLLIPEAHECHIPEMLRECAHVVVSTIKKPALDRFSMEILFEDFSDTPYSLQIQGGAVIGFFPLPDAELIERKLTIWVKGPKKVATLKAYNREVPRLPWLKPLF